MMLPLGPGSKEPGRFYLGRGDLLYVEVHGMMMEMKFDKTIVILGPTASGKTGVSIRIAKYIEAQVREKGDFCGFTGAEIISADSRAIYKEMDLGTAKPLPEEQDGIPHWGIDLVNPGERFTVADWQKYAQEKIAEIRTRGHLPMIVGGTGLYIDALAFGYDFTRIAKETQVDREEMNSEYLLVGVKTDPGILRERITERANKLFVQELYDETRRLVQKYGWGSQAMKSNVYQFAWGYLQGEYSVERAKELFIYDDWHLAKRQMTWFKRNKNIVWLSLAEIEDYVIKCIQNEQRK